MISRRFRLALAVLVVVGGVAGGLIWWRHGAADRVEPPIINLEGENDPDLANVIDDARTKVLRQPRSAEAWGWLGKVLLANGHGDDSLVCFAQAERLDPSEPRWPYLRGVAQQAINPDDALPFFREAARRVSGEDEAADVVRLRYAEALMRKGEAGQAGELLRGILQHDPDNARALLDLGILAGNANEPDEAREYLLRCAGSPITRQRAATRLSALYLQKGDPTTAERYRKSARQYPRDPDGPDPYAEEYKDLLIGRRARLLRAEGLIRSGALAEAVQLLQPMAAADDAEPEVYVKLGMALGMLGRYHDAEVVLRRDLALGHDQTQAHYFLCEAVFRQAEQSGDRAGFEEAAKEARAALARKPDHADAHLCLGRALAKLDKPDEALAELGQAVRLSPESTDAQLHLGLALLAAGRKEDGLAHLEKAVELAGDGDHRPREALKKARGEQAPP
jgi:cytochrome c-type biogenesis protein CcmH/NrfG